MDKHNLSDIEIQTAIHRVMCGLPITDCEREALNAHIDQCERSQNRFFVIVLLLAIAAACAVCAVIFFAL